MDKVSTREDSFEQQMCTVVEAYFLFNIENDPLPDATDDELVFDPKRTGRRRRQLLYCFEQAVKDAGLDDFHFHDLRRTFATRLRAADVHPYDIADLLGHSVPEGETKETRVTKGYARAVPQRLREAVSKLEKGKLLTFSIPQKVVGNIETV